MLGTVIEGGKLSRVEWHCQWEKAEGFPKGFIWVSLRNTDSGQLKHEMETPCA